MKNRIGIGIVLVSLFLLIGSQVLAAPPTDKNIKVQLACVTGAMQKGPTGNGDYVWGIQNQKNISVSEMSEVFEAYVTAITDPDEWGYDWGLSCKEDWVNTGCSQTMDQDTVLPDEFDLDIGQQDNGCHADNEEYEFITIFTTCCKIVAN